MALETLKGIKKLGGFPVVVMDELRTLHPEKFNESGAMDYKWFEAEIRPHHFIYVRHDVNSISFTLQNGPVKEKGVNGVQVDQLLQAAAVILEGLNKQVPSRETALALTNTQQAIHWLAHRTKDREERGVEGTSQK